MDALTASKSKDALQFDKKPEEISKKDQDKMNRTTCDIIRSYLTQDMKYYVINETSVGEIWKILKSKYLTKNIEPLASPEEALPHPVE